MSNLQVIVEKCASLGILVVIGMYFRLIKQLVAAYMHIGCGQSAGLTYTNIME